jgi:hypothetical protein
MMDDIFVGKWQNVSGDRYKITVSLTLERLARAHRASGTMLNPNEIQKINITLDVSINQKIMDKFARQYIYLQS